MDGFDIKYFLAANSCEGFISSFKDCYSAQDGWKAFIIKGGPGTGKSSFMKYIAVRAKDKKIKTELCFCSSDPDSLDAVIFPQIRVMILDGTSPHVLDPAYPGVCEKILNFGDFWLEKGFAEKEKNIIDLTDKNKALHNTAARYLSAMGELLRENVKIAQLATENKKTVKFAKTLCSKYIPKKSKAHGTEQVRYLCGATPKGVVSFAGTAISGIKTPIIIEDRIGNVSNIIMQQIREFALDFGYNIITVKNNFLPHTLIDHIIIPDLSVAFLREYQYQHFNTPLRRIHARRFLNANKLNFYRERIKLNNHLSKELLEGAIITLKKAKIVHDELENYYVSVMDFDLLTEFANEFVKNLFG